MSDASDRINEIADEIQTLVHEARSIAKEKSPGMLDNWDAYVFEQLEEHIDKANPYNTDLRDIAKALDFDEDEEDEIEDEDLEES
jgi:hypothetical protein